MEQLVKLAKRLARPCPYDPAIDAACATAVRVFDGDINAYGQFQYHHYSLKETLLGFVTRTGMPLTLAALAARGDVDPNKCDHAGISPLSNVFNCRTMSIQSFLAAFPSLDVNRPMSGETPLCRALAYRSCTCADVEALLNAGAQVQQKNEWNYEWYRWVTSDKRAVITDHLAWSATRRAWLAVCVAISMDD